MRGDTPVRYCGCTVKRTNCTAGAKRVGRGVTCTSQRRRHMKAMLLKAPRTPLVLENVPDPVPGPGEVVAKVLACGAGLTIHHARAGRTVLKKYPQILGHEITAEVVALGAGV